MCEELNANKNNKIIPFINIYSEHLWIIFQIDINSKNCLNTILTFKTFYGGIDLSSFDTSIM